MNTRDPRPWAPCGVTEIVSGRPGGDDPVGGDPAPFRKMNFVSFLEERSMPLMVAKGRWRARARGRTPGRRALRQLYGLPSPSDTAG